MQNEEMMRRLHVATEFPMPLGPVGPGVVSRGALLPRKRTTSVSCGCQKSAWIQACDQYLGMEWNEICE